MLTPQACKVSVPWWGWECHSDFNPFSSEYTLLLQSKQPLWVLQEAISMVLLRVGKLMLAPATKAGRGDKQMHRTAKVYHNRTWCWLRKQQAGKRNSWWHDFSSRSHVEHSNKIHEQKIEFSGSRECSTDNSCKQCGIYLDLLNL